MKTFERIFLGIWCAFAAFISPVWLTMAFLDITGLIYQHDTEEGAAVIIGILELTLWLLFVLLPAVFFFKLMNASRRGLLLFWAIILLPALLCAALCGWDIVRFLTTPMMFLTFNKLF